MVIKRQIQLVDSSREGLQQVEVVKRRLMARLGQMMREQTLKLPALQVEQVKKGHFEAIYEDNVWKLKPSSNDQKWKIGVEYLFVKQYPIPSP